eukprot:564465-Prymnesium_polylepis.1
MTAVAAVPMDGASPANRERKHVSAYTCALRLARSEVTFREHAWHVPGVRMVDVPSLAGSIGSRSEGFR